MTEFRQLGVEIHHWTSSQANYSETFNEPLTGVEPVTFSLPCCV